MFCSCWMCSYIIFIYIIYTLYIKDYKSNYWHSLDGWIDMIDYKKFRLNLNLHLDWKKELRQTSQTIDWFTSKLTKRSIFSYPSIRWNIGNKPCIIIINRIICRFPIETIQYKPLKSSIPSWSCDFPLGRFFHWGMKSCTSTSMSATSPATLSDLELRVKLNKNTLW